MAQRLVDQFFTPASMQHMAEATAALDPDFDRAAFLAALLDADWEARPLMDRLRHCAACLREALPQDYRACLAILRDLAPAVEGFESMALPEIVGQSGLDDWEASMPALAWLTRFGSSEFAVRAFIQQDPDRAIPWMERWTQDENEHVRRLASEGCRPRLPWGKALPMFKQDPSPILPVLEALKADPSEYVRRSVANNLNDIAKDNPEITLSVGERWIGSRPETDWIVKHACRSLLKAGHPRALALFGFEPPEDIRVQGLNLKPDRPAIGEAARLSFELVLGPKSPELLRVDIGVDYLKASGRQSRKVFKLAERRFLAPGRHVLERKLDFQERSTRKHYPGPHGLALIVNGRELADLSFQLDPAPTD